LPTKNIKNAFKIRNLVFMTLISEICQK
jgi:hypothetical protein